MILNLNKTLTFSLYSLLVISYLHQSVFASNKPIEDEVITIKTSSSKVGVTGIKDDPVILGAVEGITAEYDRLRKSGSRDHRITLIKAPVLSASQVARGVEHDAEIQTKIISNLGEAIPEEAVRAALAKHTPQARKSRSQGSPGFTLRVGSCILKEDLMYFIQSSAMEELNKHLPRVISEIIVCYVGEDSVLNFERYNVGNALMDLLLENGGYYRRQALFYSKDQQAAEYDRRVCISIHRSINPVQELAYGCQAIKIVSLTPAQLVKIIEKGMFNDIYLDRVRFESRRPIVEKAQVLEALKKQEPVAERLYYSQAERDQMGRLARLARWEEGFVFTTLHIKGQKYFYYQGGYYNHRINPLISSWLSIYEQLSYAKKEGAPTREEEIEKMQGYKLDWE
jgi:hypothetical protein